MSNVIPNGLKQYLLDGTVNLQADPLYAALFDKNFVPDKRAMDNWGDIKANELAGQGYPSGGVALANKVASHDDNSDKGILDADDVTYLGITLADIRWVVVYKKAAQDADSKLVCFYDLGANQSPNNVDFIVKWNAGGLLTATQGS